MGLLGLRRGSEEGGGTKVSLATLGIATVVSKRKLNELDWRDTIYTYEDRTIINKILNTYYHIFYGIQLTLDKAEMHSSISGWLKVFPHLLTVGSEMSIIFYSWFKKDNTS